MSYTISRRFFTSYVRRWSLIISVSLGSLTPDALSGCPGKSGVKQESGSVALSRRAIIIILSNLP